MNILIVGSDIGLQDNFEMYSKRALEALGHKVFYFDYVKSTFFKAKKYEYVKSKLRKIGQSLRNIFPLLIKIDIKRMNEELVSQALDFNIELVIVFKGETISPEALIKIKKFKNNILLTNWLVDPFLEILSESVYPQYDCIFTPFPNYIETHYRKGARRVEFLPFGCDPQLHVRQVLSEEDRAKFSRDICFVGTWYSNREEFFEELVDLDFDFGIWGNFWDRLKSNSKLRGHVENKWLNVQEWTKVYSASKICLNSNLPVFMLGGGISMRIFEALSCGIFVLTEQSGDSFNMFKPGEDLVCFKTKEELKELVKYYLKNDGERNRIALHGQKTVHEKHTYIYRMKKIITVAQELKKGI